MRLKGKLMSACLVGCICSFLSSNSSGQAGREPDRLCYEGSVPSRVIAACSIIIESPQGDRHDLAVAFKNRANAYDDQHKHELAIKDFAEAIRLDPEDSDTFNSRGTTWTALGQYSRAIEDFNRALELKPGLAMAFSNRCFAKANVGQLQGALDDCNEALRLRPGNSNASASRAFVELKLKRPDEAIRDYDTALSQGEDPYSLFGRAVAKRMKGNLRESDDDVVRAQAIKPDIAEHMAKLGIELRLGDAGIGLTR